MLAKAVATECKCTFFNISASSLISKYVGDSEKTLKALFFLAYLHQPSIIYIDEVDSILSARQCNEHEASTRLKNEFFSQVDGVASNENDKIIIIATTNRPHELDSAALRRFVNIKNRYINI